MTMERWLVRSHSVLACCSADCRLAVGTGSGSVKFSYLVDPFSAIQSFIRSSKPTSMIEAVLNDTNYDQIQAVARQAGVCLAFVNANGGEGSDRTNLTLWQCALYPLGSKLCLTDKPLVTVTRLSRTSLLTNITPRFEFGFGGSYTTFGYSNITIGQPSSIERRFNLDSSSSLYDTAYTVSFTVANTGNLDGHEVSQLYLGFPDTAGEPLRNLRGYWMHSK